MAHLPTESVDGFPFAAPFQGTGRYPSRILGSAVLVCQAPNGVYPIGNRYFSLNQDSPAELCGWGTESHGYKTWRFSFSHDG